jgi:release factor glutamine methyltransferase
MSAIEDLQTFPIDKAAELISEINGRNSYYEAKQLYEYAKSSECSFSELVDRRINHEPVAYITNHCKFRGLDLFIDNRVLVPRSETEPLVEVAVESLPKNSSVIDVGTGSGEVALAVKNERPDLTVLGTDISKDALDVASINSTTLELDVDWHEADLLEGIKGEYNAVLANLPYLPTTKRDSYEPEMVDYEPQVALWGGKDGYDLIRRLLVGVAKRSAVSFVALEIGLTQEKDVAEFVRKAGFPTVFCTTDKKSQIRCVVGKRF